MGICQHVSNCCLSHALFFSVSYPAVNVQNFNSSWSSGLAFCALIHKHRPDLIDFKSLRAGNSEFNLQLAFETAEREFGIAPLLDVEGTTIDCNFVVVNFCLVRFGRI